ncbi:hypothetical protein A1F94_009420 [Pyrenophora tritici-repentis]|nr:hypothetical protein A1F94_009420 [Pyrenophora tritici-repentis]
MSMEQYKSDRHRYEKEQSSFQHIMTLIQSSVSPHLLRTCCLPDKTLREWIANLQLTVGVDDETEKDRARERYLAALRPMRSAAQWDTWLAEYDQAATHAETYNVPELSQLSTTTKTSWQPSIKLHPYGPPIFRIMFEIRAIDKNETGADPLTTYRDVLVNNAELGQTPIPTYKLEAQSPRLRDLQNKTLSPLLEYNAKHVDNIIASEHAFISTQRLPQNGGNLMRQ